MAEKISTSSDNLKRKLSPNSKDIPSKKSKQTDTNTQFNQNNSKHKKNNHKKEKLSYNTKGIFITCNNNNEGKAISEAYTILNEFYSEFYEDTKSELKDAPVNSTDTTVNSISSELAQEILDFKSSLKIKKFQAVDCGSKNLVFIRFDIELNPVEIVEKIFETMLKGQNENFHFSLTRYIERFLPITHVCYAGLDEIALTVPKIIELNSYKFLDGISTYQIVYKCRNNNEISRLSVIELIALTINNVTQKLKVNLTSPEHSFIVEITRGKCLMSFLRNYKRYFKYNLNSVSTTDHNNNNNNSNNNNNNNDNNNNNNDNNNENNDSNNNNTSSDNIGLEVPDISDKSKDETKDEQ